MRVNKPFSGKQKKNVLLSYVAFAWVEVCDITIFQRLFKKDTSYKFVSFLVYCAAFHSQSDCTLKFLPCSQCYRAGVSKLRPAVQMRPAKPFLSMMKK